jgi:hypothetical protein
MIIVYCAFGAFLVVTMVLCAVLRRSSGAAAARAECTEQMTSPLVEDPCMATEWMIQI